MAAVSSVEKELAKITKVKVDKYEDRQDFLAAILKAMEKLTDDEFDNLSDAAAEWHTKKAVPAFVKKKDIPDFVEAKEPPAEEATEVEEDADAEVEGTEEADPTDDNPEDDAEAESANEAAEAEADAKASKKKGKEKPTSKAKAKAKAPEEDAEETTDEVEDKPKGKTPPSKIRADYSKVTGEKDRFGITKGTKTSDAVALYEKGATAPEILDALGGRFYNVLTKLAKEGHKVENKGGKWKLTHKDDLGDTKKPATKTKKGK